MDNRAARHIALPQIDAAGQQRIAAGSVWLVGMGGVGCAVAPYLVSSGVGSVYLNDFDTVDESNLGRQILYREEDVGRRKTAAAADALGALNPAVNIVTVDERLDLAAFNEALDQVDAVIDGSDNFSTRFLVNEACVTTRTLLISAAAIRFEAQLAVLGPNYADTPCYRCLYDDADESLDDCAGNGVLAPIPGVAGTLAATECLKHLAGIGAAAGKLHLFDGLAANWAAVQISKNPSCPVCATT